MGWFGSLRVRITLLATVAVVLALVGVSVLLVWAVERSGVGQVRDAARQQVDQVAEAVAAGEPLVPPQADDARRRFPAQPRESPLRGVGTLASFTSAVPVVVQDEDGNVVDMVAPMATLGVRADREDVAALLPDDIEAIERLVGDVTERGTFTFNRVVLAGGDDFEIASRSVDSPDGPRTISAISPLADVADSVDAVIRGLWVAAPLLVLLVAATTWLAVGRALRPVELIRQQADAISHSTLSGRLPQPDTARELQRLTTTLNDMLGRLEAGSRRQREFIADASHELRTPLAAMRGELELALARPEARPWEPTARRLLEDQRRLERLTSHLLTLARLDETGGGGAPEPVDLAPLVASELEDVDGLGDGGDDGVRLDVDLAPVVVRGHVTDLAQLVRNLASNAARYAERRVAVTLFEEGGEAVLHVDDDGPGIPVADRQRVFERFTRLDRSRARRSGGVGIGLALVQRVAESHRGTVTVGDAPLGGARFEVRLPTG